MAIVPVPWELLHELGNQLAALRLCADSLRRHSGEDEPASLTVDRIVEAAESSTALLAEALAAGLGLVDALPGSVCLDRSVERQFDRILVVNHDVAVGKLVSDVLSEISQSVVTFATPEEALASVADGPDPVDVLVTAQQLGEWDGVDFAKSFLALRPDASVLVLTSGDRHDVAIDAMESPVGVVEMPFSHGVLLSETLRLKAGRGGTA